MTRRKLSVLILLLILLTLGFCRPVAADGPSTAPLPSVGDVEPLEVRLHDGRTVEAQLDPRTDSQLLWLRLATRRATMRFSFSWERVVGVSRAGRPLSPAQLQREAAAAAPPADGADAGIAPILADRDAGLLHRRSGDAALMIGPSARSAFATREKLQMLRIFARAANWDGSVETDGLLVRVEPVLADGNPAVVEGSLQVRLFGRRLRTHGRQPALGELSRWGRWIRAEDYGLDGVEFRLPYRTISPDFDADIASDAVVNVRLSAAGRGAASASTPVRLRRYERLRDQMQLLEGVRFFPEEAASRP